MNILTATASYANTSASIVGTRTPIMPLLHAECGLNGHCYQHEISHYQTCLNYPLECLNICGKVIQRKDMGNHRMLCPMEPVECPLKAVGCDVKLVRKEFESHMTSNTQQHLLLVMGTLMQRLEHLESTVRELQMARPSFPFSG